MKSIIRFRTSSILVLFTLITVLWSCGQHNTEEQLATADRLIERNETDSAFALLQQLDTVSLDKRDNGYYRLLMAIAVHKVKPEVNADSILEKSMNAIRESDDKELLARAFYERAVFACDAEKAEDSFRWLKQAEITVRETKLQKGSNLKLRHSILILMAYLNNVAGNLKLAVENAKEALDLAEMANDDKLRGNDYLQLSGSYFYMEKRDSSDFYINKLLQIIDRQDKNDLPDMLNNIAVSYYLRGDMETAKKYLEKSLRIKPQEHTYYSLAQIYSQEGKKQQAIDLWNKALGAHDLYMRERITRMYALWLKENKDYQKSAEMAVLSDSLKISLDRQRTSGEGMLLIKNDYDRQIQDRDNRRTIWIIVSVLLGFSAIIIIGWLIHSRRRKHIEESMRSRINSLQSKNDEHIRTKDALSNKILQKSQRLKKVEDEKKDIQQQLKQMQENAEHSRNRRDLLANDGHKRYNELMADEKATQWNKKDADIFWEYFTLVNPAVAGQVEENYEGLSILQKVIRALMYLDWTNERITKALGMSDGALRTAKSRMRKCRKQEP